MSELYELNEEKIVQLAQEILNMLKSRLEVEEKSRMRVYECLNGLAVAVAMVMAGTGMDPAAMSFFSDALFKQMNQITVDAARNKPQE